MELNSTTRGIRRKMERLRHWLCSSRLLLQESRQRGCMSSRIARKLTVGPLSWSWTCAAIKHCVPGNVPVGPTLIEQASSNPVLLACLSCWEGHIRLLRQPQLFLYQRQQLRRDAIESLRQVEESAQGGTLLPSLQLANIVAVVSSGVSERILGMTCLFS